MLKISHARRFTATALGAIAIVVFFTARSVALRRPQYIGVQPSIGGFRMFSTYSPPIGGDSMELSPDGQWLRAQYFGNRMYIWNVQQRTARICYLQEVKFAADSQTLVGMLLKPLDDGRGANSFSIVLQTPSGHDVWASKPMRIREHIYAVDFVGQAIQATGTKSIYLFDSQTGKLIRKSANPAPITPLEEGDLNSQRSPDGSLTYALWPRARKGRDTAAQHRVNVGPSHSGEKSWSYPARVVKSAYSTDLACFPKWEDSGKALATIENDTLFLYESQSGKVLLKQKNNLPAPLQAWAFTQDQSAVYLMDAKGEIFRQRLK